MYMHSLEKYVPMSTLFHERIAALWDEAVLPALMEFIRIPNCSPQFTAYHKPEQTNKAVMLINKFAELYKSTMILQIINATAPGRPPLICFDIPGTAPGTTLIYGHLDKQPAPESQKWNSGAGPYTPMVKDGYLYGRGAVDDGYAVFMALTAVRLLEEQKIPHGRVIILIESGEESGSIGIEAHLNQLKDIIGQPNLIICLDSGCGDYERLWLTTSLRGTVAGILRVATLRESIHSGHGSGILPQPFDVMTELLDRLRGSKTQEVLLTDLFANVPPQREQEMRAAAEILGDKIYTELPLLKNVGSISNIPYISICNNGWDPALTVIGQEGLPSLDAAANAIHPQLALKLSMRIPPTLDPGQAADSIREVLEDQPPFGARVSFTVDKKSPGWNAPEIPAWLETALRQASNMHFGKNYAAQAQGGSIPLINIFQNRFPGAAILVTGLLGPGSNAHGPDERLHIPGAHKLNACLADFIAAHAAYAADPAAAGAQNA